MPGDASAAMAKSRGLITDTEADRIAGRVDVEDSKRYQAVSRVRRRIREQLPEEIELLEEHHPDLLEELREVVCGAVYRCPRCGQFFDRPSDAHQHALHQAYQDDEHAGYDGEEVPQWWGLFPDDDEE